LIFVAYLHDNAGPDGIKVRAFNTATGLWAAETVVCPNTGGSTIEMWDLSAFGGNVRIFFVRNVAGTITLGTVEYTGGAWGGESNWGTEFTQPGITGVTIDPSNGTAHIFYSQLQSSGLNPLEPNTVLHVSIPIGGPVSGSDVAISDIPQYLSAGFNDTYPGFSNGAILNGLIFVPFTQFRVPSNQPIPAVLVGAPGSWSVVSLSPDTNVIGDPDGQQKVSIFTANAMVKDDLVYLIWATSWINDDGDRVLKIRSLTTEDGVTLSEISTQYDARIDPPSDAPEDLNTMDMSVISVAELSSGDIGVLMNMSNTNGRHFFSFAGGIIPPPPGPVEIPYFEFRGVKRFPAKECSY